MALSPQDWKAILGEIDRRKQGHSFQSATVEGFTATERGGLASVLPDGAEDPIEAVNITGVTLVPDDRVVLIYDPPAGVYVIGVLTAEEDEPAPASACLPTIKLIRTANTDYADGAPGIVSGFTFSAGSSEYASTFAIGGGGSYIEVQTEGLYLITGNVFWEPSDQGYRVLAINNSFAIASQGNPATTLGGVGSDDGDFMHAQSVSTIKDLGSLQQVELLAYQFSGGNLELRHAELAMTLLCDSVTYPG